MPIRSFDGGGGRIGKDAGTGGERAGGRDGGRGEGLFLRDDRRQDGWHAADSSAALGTCPAFDEAIGRVRSSFCNPVSLAKA